MPLLLETWWSLTMQEVSHDSSTSDYLHWKYRRFAGERGAMLVGIIFYFPPAEDGGAPSGGDSTYWPSSSVLTARLRRLITASQRFTKSRQIMQIHQNQSQTQQTMMLSTPLYPLPPSVNDVLNPKMAAKIERQQRSERREAAAPFGRLPARL